MHLTDFKRGQNRIQSFPHCRQYFRICIPPLLTIIAYPAQSGNKVTLRGQNHECAQASLNIHLYAGMHISEVHGVDLWTTQRRRVYLILSFTYCEFFIYVPCLQMSFRMCTVKLTFVGRPRKVQIAVPSTCLGKPQSSGQCRNIAFSWWVPQLCCMILQLWASSRLPAGPGS